MLDLQDEGTVILQNHT